MSSLQCGACQTVMSVAAGTAPGTVLQCPSCQAQLAVPGFAAAVPVAQTMGDATLESVLGNQKGVLVRQKLDKMEILLPMWEKRNKYKIAYMPDKPDKPFEEWDDDLFKKALKKNELMTAKEKSECCQRVCCGSRREFTMKLKAGEDTGDEGGKLAEFDRPFKCTIFCCFKYFNPQEITAKDKDDKTLGRVEQTFICPSDLCFTRHWKVMDADDNVEFLIQDNMCKDCNMCAPSPCCKVRTLEILDAEGNEVVGSIMNIFPGCTLRSFFGDADNFLLQFPEKATPAQKTTLLAANILIDFMMFEKNEKNDGAIQL